MAALFGYCGPEQPRLLERMAARLGHRIRPGCGPGCGPVGADADARWHEARRLGWERTEVDLGEGRRVAIAHAMGPVGRGPQVAADAGGCVGWAGILFDPPAASGPASDRSTPDGHRALLATLSQRGLAAAEQIDGAFVLAWHDGDALHLLRDPAGIKALYWAQVGKRLIFASEIKALLADPALRARLRPAALAEYFTFSFIPGERTMLEDVHELQPGTWLTFRDARVEKRRWFLFEGLEWRAGEPADPARHVALIRRTLAETTEQCLRAAGDPPGLFLSGGIDSSAVLAMAARLRPDRPLRTYSVHFGRDYPNELEYIDLMARQCRSDHRVLELTPRDFSDRLETICWHLDDPIGDPVTMPNYLLAEQAAQDGAAVLNGEGGDPCFGGPKNIPMLLDSLYAPPAGQDADGWLERQYLHSFQRAHADLDELLGPAVRMAVNGDEDLVAIIRPFLRTETPVHLLNRLMAMNIRLKGANLILVKVEKMTAANGLLALPPLFTRRIIEASMAVPPALKLAGNVEKAVLKQAVADLVPQPIIDRPKSGMRVPVHYWFQGELRRYARRRLSRRRLRRLGLFDVDYVMRILRYDSQEVPGRRHGLKLWMLITFLLWHERVFGEAG